MGPEDPIILKSPSPDIPGAPLAPSVTEQKVEQGTIPSWEKTSDELKAEQKSRAEVYRRWIPLLFQDTKGFWSS